MLDQHSVFSSCCAVTVKKKSLHPWHKDLLLEIFARKATTGKATSAEEALSEIREAFPGEAEPTINSIRAFFSARAKEQKRDLSLIEKEFKKAGSAKRKRDDEEEEDEEEDEEQEEEEEGNDPMEVDEQEEEEQQPKRKQAEKKKQPPAKQPPKKKRRTS